LCRDDICILVNSETEYALHGLEDKKIDQYSKIIPLLLQEMTEDSYFKIFKSEDSLI
jgi:hypothetical protein